MVSAGHRRYGLRTLAILSSWECDAACHHCVFNSSPRAKGQLPLETLLSFVGEVVDCSDLERVTLSGGEALLFPEYVRDVVSHCSSLDLSVRVVTNGSFAKSHSIAVDQLSRLMEAGLNSLGVSWDRFHKLFITPDMVKNTLKACRSLGLPVDVTCVVSEECRLEQSLELLGDEAFELRVVQVKALPIGRGARKLDRSKLFAASYWEKGRACKNDFDTLSITPDGTVYPCCAVGGFTPGIALGCYPESTAYELLTKRENDLRWMMLANKGPSYLMQFASGQEKELVGLDTSVHDCVNCNRMFANSLGDELVGRATKEVDQAAKLLALEGGFI